MKSVNAKLVLSSLSIALLSGPAVAQHLLDESTDSAAQFSSGRFVMIRGQVVSVDPGAQIRNQLFREGGLLAQ
jgi:hypothetical protein